MEKEKTPVQLIAEREILRTMKRIAPKAAIEVSMESDRRVNIYITEKYIPKIIGKGGKRIAELEEDIGISMNVEPLEKAPDSFAERLSKRSKKSKSKKDKKDKHKKSKKSQLKEYNDNLDNYVIDEGKKDYSKDNYFDLSEESEEYDDEDFDEGETSEFYYEVFELHPEIRKDHLVLPIGKKFVGNSFDILLEDKYLFTATVGKRGYVKLHKNLDLTDEIIDGLDKGLRVAARVRD
jgi:ATPase